MKKMIALLLALALITCLASCGSQADTGEAAAGPTGDAQDGADKKLGKTVGICMPNDDAYWADGASALEASLLELGYDIRVQYAQDDVQEQLRQIEELIALPVDCLVIAAVDSVALVELEEEAGAAGIPIIAYDRLLMDTAAVSAMVTFDYAGIGASIAQYIVDAKQLQTAAAEQRSYTIEFFMGSPDDNSALLLHSGIMAVLQEYLDSGALVCRTGRISFEDTYTLRWDAQAAKLKCADYLADYYAESPLDIVCAASDALARGCAEVLSLAGYTQENWPVITGQGGELAAVKQVLAGQQTVTVYKDTDMLTQKCAEMAHALVSGAEPEVNDTASGDNHVITVPAYVCDSSVVDGQNYEKVLVDSGIYKESQLKDK